MEDRPSERDLIAQNLQPRTLEAVADFQTTLDAVFEGDERRQVEDALWLMCEVHIDQDDRSDGVPYIEHPLEVAHNVVRTSATPDVDKVIAALMHDSVEDHAPKLVAKAREAGLVGEGDVQLALEYLKFRFNTKVARLTAALTNPDFEAELIKQGRKPTRQAKDALYVEHVRGVIEDRDVVHVKLFDFVSNGFRLHEVPDHARRHRLTRKYVPLVDVFVTRLTDGTPTGIDPATQAQLIIRLTQAESDMRDWLRGIGNSVVASA